jgi:flagellar basal-body rod protein FlgB
VELNLLSDVTSQALAAALRGTAARQTVIADNVANVDTPGFTRNDVEFETALATALDETRRAPFSSADRISALSFGKSRDYASPARADGNNVDIDREMAALARNTLGSRAASEMLGTRVRMLRAVINASRQ